MQGDAGGQSWALGVVLGTPEQGGPQGRGCHDPVPEVSGARPPLTFGVEANAVLDLGGKTPQKPQAETLGQAFGTSGFSSAQWYPGRGDGERRLSMGLAKDAEKTSKYQDWFGLWQRLVSPVAGHTGDFWLCRRLPKVTSGPTNLILTSSGERAAPLLTAMQDSPLSGCSEVSFLIKYICFVKLPKNNPRLVHAGGWR